MSARNDEGRALAPESSAQAGLATTPHRNNGASRIPRGGISSEVAQIIPQRPEVIDWLRARGITSGGDHLSLCTGRGSDFRGDVLPAGKAAETAHDRRVGTDVYISANPMRPGIAGKGGAQDIVSLVALWADLDVGPGKLPSRDVAEQVVRELAAMLNCPPASITDSGHGLQPVWAIERAPITDDEQRRDAAHLMARWHALVAQVARTLAPGAKVDNVSNLDRILRVPGTQNCKHPEAIVPARLVHLDVDARRLTLEEVRDVLAEHLPDEVAEVDQRGPQAAPKRPQSADDRSKEADLLTKHLGRLDALRTKTWEQRPEGWHNASFEVACLLVQLANSPWSSHTHDSARALFFEHAPRNAEHDERAKNWTEAVAKVGDKALDGPEPRATIGHMATAPPAKTTPAAQHGQVISPAVFFNGDGLRAKALTAHVEAQGPVATSPDGEVWTYDAGVWRPGEREVRRRIGACLGDRYRKAHAETILDLIRAGEPLITDRPQPRYVNFRNGMLDLHSGTLVAHAPEFYSTNQLGVSWRPEATCPAILAWLGQVLPDPTEQRVWLELVGYSAYGDNPLHKAALLDGGGRNGKGTTLRVITALLGRENVAAVPPQKLDTDRWAAADLFGVLANLAGDVSPRSFTETETFKQVTGGDLIRGERKHRNAFKFVSRAFLIGSFNRLPTSADHSEGFFSRWVVLPFRAQIAEPDEHGNVPAGTIRKDPTVEQRLLAPSELEGLAVLAMGALRDLLARGAFTETESGRAAQQEFRQHADPLRGFLAEAVTASPGCHVPLPTLYTAYRNWCADNGLKPRGRNNFNADVRTVHVEIFGQPANDDKYRGANVWHGLQLNADHWPLAGGGRDG